LLRLDFKRIDALYVWRYVSDLELIIVKKVMLEACYV
jgi:hypothetical protein